MRPRRCGRSPRTRSPVRCGCPPSLADAIAQQGFVQLDPIRAPARAADLILRHRVDGYRAGDLDRAYPSLPLAEDYLHVYGVLPLAVQRLLHPRSAAPPAPDRARASAARAPRARPRGARRARRTRATWRRCCATSGSSGVGAARPRRPRTCSRRCTTAASCASCGARTASRSTTSRCPRHPLRNSRRRSARAASCVRCCISTRRCPSLRCASWRAW